MDFTGSVIVTTSNDSAYTVTGVPSSDILVPTEFFAGDGDLARLTFGDVTVETDSNGVAETVTVVLEAYVTQVDATSPGAGDTFTIRTEVLSN